MKLREPDIKKIEVSICYEAKNYLQNLVQKPGRLWKFGTPLTCISSCAPEANVTKIEFCEASLPSRANISLIELLICKKIHENSCKNILENPIQVLKDTIRLNTRSMKKDLTPPETSNCEIARIRTFVTCFLWVRRWRSNSSITLRNINSTTCKTFKCYLSRMPNIIIARIEHPGL